MSCLKALRLMKDAFLKILKKRERRFSSFRGNIRSNRKIFGRIMKQIVLLISLMFCLPVLSSGRKTVETLFSEKKRKGNHKRNRSILIPEAPSNEQRSDWRVEAIAELTEQELRKKEK